MQGENTNNTSIYKPIVFVNKPIEEEKDDVIGFSSQVETLESAIYSGANMIGVIAGFGTGKSSMTELLLKKLEKNKETFKESIRINLWDCLRKTDASDESTSEKVSLLTKSFLYQLANGHERKFGSFINKVLSKNYGSVSFGVNSKKFWIFTVLSGLAFSIYKIFSQRGTGIMSYVPEWLQVTAPLAHTFAPVFLFLSIVLLAVGLIDSYIAFSHWKMQEKRELEISDVFDTYTTIINKFYGSKKENNKKTIVFIDDLDRIAEKNVVIEFLKEIYRFQDALGKNKDNFVFVISIKPESQLDDKNHDDKKLYSKIFDTVLYLNPIHFDDYDSLLLKLINNNLEQKANLEILLDCKITTSLPLSFKWIKKGQNLSLRDLKDRLNHAIAIMLSIRNKNYQVKTAVNFEACAAVSYLESAYPDEYHKLIHSEAEFAEFMKKSVAIVNENPVNITEQLNQRFNNAFSKAGLTKKEFIDELCVLVSSRVLNDDFRMYFYTYPKGSHIKTTQERELCDYLIFSKREKASDNIDELVKYVFENGGRSIITDVIKSLETFPYVVLESSDLFLTAMGVSFDKAFKIFAAYAIDSGYEPKEKSRFWAILNDMSSDNYKKFKKAAVAHITAEIKDNTRMVELRKSIILGIGEKIADFKELYKKPQPVITNEEISLINHKNIAIALIQCNLLHKDSFDAVTDLINNSSITDKVTFDNACNILSRYQTIIECAVISKALVKFMSLNSYMKDEFVELIEKSEDNSQEVAEYFNKLNAKDFSEKYLKAIDELRFKEHISPEIVELLINGGFYKTALYYCAHNDCFAMFKNKLGDSAKITEACNVVNDEDPNIIIGFRKYAFYQGDKDAYRELYFNPYAYVGSDEFVNATSNLDAISLIDTSQIDEDNCNNTADIIALRDYSVEELMYLFEYLFDSEKNEICITDISTKVELINCLDYQKIGLKKLSEEQSEQFFELIKDASAYTKAENAVKMMQLFGMLIPTLEKVVQGVNGTDVLYSKLIAEMDMFTSATEKWLDENYIHCGLSEKLCNRLYELHDYQNFIVADVLRKNDMIIDSTIEFKHYINVYLRVEEMFDIMSKHWDFLEGLQEQAVLKDVSEEHLKPAICVPQHTRMFKYIFEEQRDESLKIWYLNNFLGFKEHADSKAFQSLICSENNMKLLGDIKLYERIHQKLYSDHKGAFTRKWKESWRHLISEQKEPALV